MPSYVLLSSSYLQSYCVVFLYADSTEGVKTDLCVCKISCPLLTFNLIDLFFYIQAAVKVLSEDGTTKVFQVDGSHRVEEVCRQMVARNNALSDKSWSLVEELTELDLGKTVHT